MTTVEEYESHEEWLTRQQDVLALIDETIRTLPGGPPEPRVLPLLPWWRDWDRVNGEAWRVLDGLAGLAVDLLKGFIDGFVWLVRAGLGRVLGVLLVLWLLFAGGLWLFQLTLNLL